MNKTLKLKTYDNQSEYFVIENVEDIVCMFRYTASGDECAVVAYKDGSHIVIDCNAGSRLMDFGPDNIDVLLPGDIEWETKPYDA